MSLIVNRRDIDFLFYEVGDLDELLRNGSYAEFDRASIDAVLDLAQNMAERAFLPFAGALDANEPAFDGEKVSMMPQVGDALYAFAEAGFFAAGFDQEIGGLGLPSVVCQAVQGMFACANLSVAGYSFLTVAAANLLNECGDAEQKAMFLPKMLEGKWFGTMCLSEPQAGSSLSDIKTMATPTDDGHYRITGSKMWISGGEQEISENIVHMVLAKIPGGPPGVKGISLFIVPKYRVNPDGSVGEKNNVSLIGLNHKMGYRGTTNCALNFGEAGECRGYLVGEPHQGLKYMFNMMNEARLAVGAGATMSALGGYLYSLQYARERLQGRHPGDKDPASPQIAIIEHADVKRLLMTQKAYVEGALALLYYCATLVDRQRLSTDDDERLELKLLLDILTPVAKSWPSEFCLEANKHAIQVLGGYGYTRDYPVERHYRDNRINAIHEGTHGIQGLDLLGRKVRMHDGAALKLLTAEIEKTLAAASTTVGREGEARTLKEALDQCHSTIMRVSQCSDVNRALANATPFLDAFGHVVIGWMWLRQAIAAINGLESGKEADKDFYRGKIAACRFFFNYELPKTEHVFRLVGSLDDTCLTVTPESFIGE